MIPTTFKLHSSNSAEQVPYADSTQIPAKAQFKILQERASQTLDLASEINDSGYNVYLAGDTNLGRSYFLRKYLESQAKKMPLPSDLMYVHNFENQDKPVLITLPAGIGASFKENLAKILQVIRKEIQNQFESVLYYESKEKLKDAFNTKKYELFGNLNTFSENLNHAVEFDEKYNPSFFPLLNGKKIAEEDFINLSQEERKKIYNSNDLLSKEALEFKKLLFQEEMHLKKIESELDKQFIEAILTHSLDPFKEKIIAFYAKHANIPQEKIENNTEINKLNQFISDIRKDIVENYDIFLPKEQHNSMQDSLQNVQDIEIIRHDVNLIVDNSKIKHAPIIFEDNPSAHNLLGCIEKEAEMGTHTTDFSLIHAGSLHRAQGGFLVIHANDILQNPNLWDIFLRTLKAQELRISESYEQSESIKTKSITPEAMPLNVKIVLVGNDELYENLLENDERFSKFFKLKAQMKPTIPRNAKNIRAYLAHIKLILDEANLLPFSASALQYIIDYSSLLAEDQKSLSLEFPIIRELLLEASALATKNKLPLVEAETLEHAYNSSIYRRNLAKEIYFEEYKRNIIKIETAGAKVGAINALSIVSYADYDFGLPHQISCSVGVGHDGLISLEREVEQSGSIHSKAILIIKSFMNLHFARKKALTFNASLYFEQSYIGIDGDSASLAELLCLLSALADIPLKLSYACTGSVNQEGKVLSVGGINQKIEAFYSLCKSRKLDKKQGIIIPYENIDNLMLSKKIQDAVHNGLFHIYPIKDISEAIELYTAMKSGNLRKDSTFTPNSFFDHVDRRLKDLAMYADGDLKRKTKDKK